MFDREVPNHYAPATRSLHQEIIRQVEYFWGPETLHVKLPFSTMKEEIELAKKAG